MFDRIDVFGSFLGVVLICAGVRSCTVERTYTVKVGSTLVSHTVFVPGTVLVSCVGSNGPYYMDNCGFVWPLFPGMGTAVVSRVVLR